MAEKRPVFELKKSKEGLDIRFSSTLAHIDEVCTQVTRFMEEGRKGLSAHLFAVNLVIREGLTNAVRHGNENDPDKWVRFFMEIDSKTIRVSIRDQGRGFDRDAVQKAYRPEAADHGRGISIMETYFDRCRFNAAGNVLYLEKDTSRRSGQEI